MDDKVRVDKFGNALVVPQIKLTIGTEMVFMGTWLPADLARELAARLVHLAEQCV